MTLQLETAQRVLSCLLSQATEKPCSENNGAPVSKRCLSHERMVCQAVEQLCTHEIVAGRDAAMAHEYYCKEEMIRMRQGDVGPSKYVFGMLQE